MFLTSTLCASERPVDQPQNAPKHASNRKIATKKRTEIKKCDIIQIPGKPSGHIAQTFENIRLLSLGLLLLLLLIVVFGTLALLAIFLVGLLGILLGLLQVLLADCSGVAFFIEGDLATLELPLVSLNAETSLGSQFLNVALLGLLLRGLSLGLIRILSLIRVGISHLLILNLLDELLLLLLRLLDGGRLLGGQGIGIGVVLAGFLQVELLGLNTVGGDSHATGLNGLALHTSKLALEVEAGLGTESSLVLLGGIVIPLSEGVDTDTQRGLGGEDAGHLTLVAAGGLADQRSVVDQTVLGSIVLSLEGTEKGLLGTQNLDGTGGALGQAGEGASVGNKTGTNEVTDKGSQVGCDGVHAGSEVAGKLGAVVVEANDLLGESLDVLQILGADLSTHGAIGSSLDGTLDLLGEDLSKISGLPVGAHTHLQNELGVGNVVVEDLSQLGEVPSVPFLDTHSVGVQLLVKIIEKTNGLDDHSVDLVGGELELVTGERVGQTKGHGGHITGGKAGNEGGEVLTDGTEDVVGAGVSNQLNVKTGKLADGVSYSQPQLAYILREEILQDRPTELGIGNGERHLLLILDSVKKRGQGGGDLALHDGGSLLQS